VRDETGRGRLRWKLRVTDERCDGILVLTPVGRLSHTTAKDLAVALKAAATREPGGLVLDFGQVDYISSAGLLTIEAAASELGQSQGALVLCSMLDAVRIAFELAGLLPRFTIEPSRQTAIARVKSLR